MFQKFVSLFSFTSSCLEIEMDMGISCARSHQASDGQDALNDPGQRQLSPLRNRGQHLLAELPRCMYVSATGPHSTTVLPSKNFY